MLQRKKILVTGGNGQLGSELKTISLRYPQYEFLFPAGSELRIDDTEAVKKIFAAASPSFCINCAAYTAVDKAETDQEQAMIVNGAAVGQLAATCREFNTGFIHISTDYVFDGEATKPYFEDAPTNPLNVYGATKLEGEKNAIAQNPDTVIIRTSWVYSSYGKNFVKTMMRLMGEKATLNVVNDQVGSPTYAADLADCIMKIIIFPQWKPGIFHYSNSGIISWFEFAIAIKRLSKSGCDLYPIPASKYPTPAKRPAYSVLDNAKINASYGIEPKPWEASLAQCLQILL